MKTLMIGATILLSGCSEQGVVGTWRAAPHESEIGMVVETIVLRSDGSCVYGLAHTKHPGDEMVTTSKWTRSGSALLIQTDKVGQTPLRLTLKGSSTLTSDIGLDFRKE